MIRLFATDLPAPPAFERWVFEQPIPLAAACLAAGIGISIALSRRGETRRAILAGLLFATLSATVFLTGLFTTTTRERLTELTSEFIRRVIAADADWASEHIADSLIVVSAGEGYVGFGKPQLVDTIRGFDYFRTEEWHEKPRGAAIDAEGLARTQTTVRIKAGYLQSQMIPSTWEFTWNRTNEDRWLLTRLECLTMWGQPPKINWERDARSLGNFKPGRPSAGGLQPERN